jgi:negative regulator of flagellin synthesis FlgM
MSIKFIGIGGPGQIGNVTKSQKPQADTKTEGKTGTDQVQFSSVLQDVHKAQNAQKSSESARAERVQELKAQIADGSYKPDLDKVATSLLQFMFKGK